MHNKIKMLLVSAFGLSLMACGSDVIESKNVQIDTRGNLYVSLRDANGNLIKQGDSVKVTLLTNENKTKIADSLGSVAFRDLQVGDYRVLVEKSGYASQVCDGEIWMAASDETPVASDATIDVVLYKIGASVNGTAIRNNTANINGTEKLNATDAQVSLKLNNNGDCYFVDNTFNTEVSSAGTYSFENLPELSSFTIRGLALTVGTELYTANTVSGTTGFISENIKLNQLSYNVNTDPFTIISTNIEDVAINDAIVIAFSKPVDVARIRTGDIYVSNNTAINTAWSKTKDTLTVTSVTGKWLFGSSFYLYFTIYSVDGVYIGNASSNSVYVSIYTDGKLDAVKGLQALNKTDTLINYNTNSASLIWNKLANAAGYEIYRKASTDSAFVLYTTLNSPNDTTYSVGGNVFSDGKSVQIVVLGFNSVGRSAFDAKTALTLYDKLKPTYTVSYTSQTSASSITTAGASGLDWVIATDASYVTASASTNLDLYNSASIYPLIINFTEPMDTTTFSVANNITLTVDGTTNSSDKLTYTKEWNSQGTVLTIRPFVVANKNAYDVSLRTTVSIADVKDKKGNAVPTAYNSLSVLYKHESL